MAAFRATLEEVLEADLILHVRDVAHPESAEQAADVADILGRLGVGAEVAMIEVWNKIDLLDPTARAALEAQAGHAAPEGRGGRVMAVSAATGDGVAALLGAVEDAVGARVREAEVAVPFADGRRRAWLHDAGVVRDEETREDGWHLHLRWTEAQARAFAVL